MREESRVLEYVPDAAALGGKRIACHCVDEYEAPKPHMPRVGPEKSRDDLNHGRLAASGAAEERDDARRRGFECDVERKGAAALGYGDGEHQRPSQRRTRRASHSAIRRPTNPSVKEM